MSTVSTPSRPSLIPAIGRAFSSLGQAVRSSLRVGRVRTAPYHGSIDRRIEGGFRLRAAPASCEALRKRWRELGAGRSSQLDASPLSALKGVHLWILSAGEEPVLGSCFYTEAFGTSWGKIKYLQFGVPLTTSHPLIVRRARGTSEFHLHGALAEALRVTCQEVGAHATVFSGLGAGVEAENAIASLDGFRISIGNTWTLDVSGAATLDEFLRGRGLKRKKRLRFKHGLRSVTDGSLIFAVAPISEIGARSVLEPLLENAEKYGYQQREQLPAYLRLLEQADGSATRVACLRHGAQVVATLILGSCAAADEAEVSLVGVRHGRVEGVNLYHTLFVRTLKWLIEEQRVTRRVHLGMTCDDDKRRLGADPTPAHALVVPTTRALTWASPIVTRLVTETVVKPVRAGARS